MICLTIEHEHCLTIEHDPTSPEFRGLTTYVLSNKSQSLSGKVSRKLGHQKYHLSKIKAKAFKKHIPSLLSRDARISC